MKKSITLLAIALITSVNVVSANNLKSNVNSTDFNSSTVSSFGTNNLTSTKFVSMADPNLITSELGSLKKTTKSIDEIIADDNKVIEGKVSYNNFKKAKKNNSIQLKSPLKN